MAFMRLCRGFNVYDADFVEYPIYEMTIPANATVYPWGWGTFPTGTAGDAITFDYSPNNEDLSQFFPESMPRRNTHDGCIVQNDFYYVQGPTSRIPNQQAFADVPIGTKPDDWDTHFFDYYKIIQMGNYTVFDSVSNGALDYVGSPPVWDSTTSYYHDELPIKSRTTQLFTTAAGVTFKVGVSTNTYYSYNRWECNINGNNPYGSPDQVSCPHYMGAPTGGLANNTLSYPNKLPVSPNELNLPTNLLQIFVHTVYNDKDYYGYGVVRMSAISDTAHPTQANFCLFTEDFWGDSIQGGSPSQEGDWGAPIERAGGHGSFSDPSDDSGSFNGTTLAADIAAHAAVMNANIQAGGFHVYRLASGAMAAISRVLFSQSFFGLFTVSRYNPLSCILSYHLLPDTLAPLTLDGTAQTAAVQAGGYNFATDPDTPVQVPFQSLVDSETHYFVGAADIPYYYDAFPDFAPFTHAKIHLPYIGEMTLDINKFQGGKIAVDYNCDVISGNVCAVITCQDRNGRRREVYTATGNAAYTLPVFSESQSGAAVGKLIGSGVTAAVTGNAAGILGAAAGALEMAAVGVPHSPQIQGSFGGNVGAIGNHICFLEITRPEWVETERFQELAGIPSGLSGTITELEASGFIQVQTIETEGIAATQAECDLIEQILKSGIYVK